MVVLVVGCSVFRDFSLSVGLAAAILTMLVMPQMLLLGLIVLGVVVGVAVLMGFGGIGIRVSVFDRISPLQLPLFLVPLAGVGLCLMLCALLLLVFIVPLMPIMPLMPIVPLMPIDLLMPIAALVPIAALLVPIMPIESVADSRSRVSGAVGGGLPSTRTLKLGTLLARNSRPRDRCRPSLSSSLFCCRSELLPFTCGSR